MRSLWQSFSLFLSTSLLPVIAFHFLFLECKPDWFFGTFGDFWDSDTSQWSISVWEHSALYCDFQVLLAADPAVTTVHPCCVCLFCAHRMCWRMMRTLAMPIAPSLMKVGARPGWMRKEFFLCKINCREFARMPFSFPHNHIHSLLSLSCCQSSYFPHSIKRAIIGKAVAVSLSLSCVYLWVSCCTWNMCVWKSAAGLLLVSKRCYVITVWFNVGLLFAFRGTQFMWGG